MSDRTKIPFQEIAAACLARAEELVREWLPDGRREGPEWKALNPTRADSKVGSFSVNVINGHWADFATDDKGGDLVSLNAYLFHAGDQGKAAIECAERVGVQLPDTPRGKVRRAERVVPPPPPEKPAEPRTWWKPIWPAPGDAGDPPKAHPRRGVPSRIFTYRTGTGGVIGYVCRFITSDGGKDDIPLVFAQHEKSSKREWRWMAFAEQDRPLYGLDRAAAKPDATLLFVEGEKCADAADQALPGLAALSWPGGCNGVGKADFGTLADRVVKKAILWPDCDAKREKLAKEEKEAGVDPASKSLLPEDKQPGTKAMNNVAEQLHALGYKVWRVRIPAPGEKPDGWDIADAIEDGWTQATLEETLKASQLLAPHVGPPESISTPTEADAGQEVKRPFIPGLVFGRDGLKACMANVYLILSHSPEWRGVVGYDEFSLQVMKRQAPPFAEGSLGEWTSTDDSRTAIWMAQRWDFTPSSDLVAEAIETLARDHAFHPVRDWLRSLEWDGRPRLNTWLSDYLGVIADRYTELVGRWWVMGAVKRVMRPGCKFDYCLVLEGHQGKGKSTALSILGGEWFGDTDLDLGHKDSMSALRGKFIYEISELGALARAEEKRQKSFLSRRQDEYRPVYGRREIKAPRQVVFAGTTNEFEWNKDPTGGRRFWPIECFGDFNLDGLRDVRDQLFAEALAELRKGERCYPTPEEQKELFDPKQIKIEQQDSIADAIHDWVYAQAGKFSIWDIARDCLKIDASKLTRDLQTRIGHALRKFGCRRIEKRNGTVRFWYEPPEERGHVRGTGVSQQPSEEDFNAGF